MANKDSAKKVALDFLFRWVLLFGVFLAVQAYRENLSLIGVIAGGAVMAFIAVVGALFELRRKPAECSSRSVHK